MKKQLLDLINQTILFKYELPYAAAKIPKTILSTHNDKCYEASNNNDLSKIIYNAIVEYSFNEFDIDKSNYENLHARAFQERIRFNEDDADSTQLKYGFFGEVILHVILKIMFGTEIIISKGYFFSPIENSESKGFDAYHLIDTNGNLQLWFGETKFHQSYKQAIDGVLGKIKTTISNTYMRRNLLAIRKNKDNLNTQNSTLQGILDTWEENPSIVIMDELYKYNISLVYPVIILYQQNSNGYDENIKLIPKYIKEKYQVENYDLSIPYSLFFVLIPIENVKAVKTEVLSWIKSKKQLL